MKLSLHLKFCFNSRRFKSATPQSSTLFHLRDFEYGKHNFFNLEYHSTCPELVEIKATRNVHVTHSFTTSWWLYQNDTVKIAHEWPKKVSIPYSKQNEDAKLPKLQFPNEMLVAPKKIKIYSFVLPSLNNFITFSYTMNVIEEAGTFFSMLGVIPL